MMLNTTKQMKMDEVPHHHLFYKNILNSQCWMLNLAMFMKFSKNYLNTPGSTNEW